MPKKRNYSAARTQYLKVAPREEKHGNTDDLLNHTQSKMMKQHQMMKLYLFDLYIMEESGREGLIEMTR